MRRVVAATPPSSGSPPTVSARSGGSPCTAHAASIPTTGTGSANGTTAAAGCRPSGYVAEPMSLLPPAVDGPARRADLLRSARDEDAEQVTGRVGVDP